METISAVAAIDKLEALFAAGQIVDIIEGTPLRAYALVRLDREADRLYPVILGRMTPVDYNSLLSWHEAKWIELLKDPQFKEWADSHPIPEGKPSAK